jgi:signal transduction histidine kinase
MRLRVSRQGLGQSVVRKVSQLWSSVGLGAKMAAIVVFGTLSLLALFAYLGTTALNENNQRTLQERMVLAQTTARHIDYVLSNIEEVLTYTAAQSSWRDAQHRDENLADAFQRLSVYATRVFLLDSSAHLISAYPPVDSPISFDQFASVQAVLTGRSFAVSRFLRNLDNLATSTLAAVPLHDANGQVIGALVVSIDLTKPNLQTFTHPMGLGETGYIDLIDLGGTILASTRSERVGVQSDHGDTLATLIREERQTVSACHDCHTPSPTTFPTREVLAFAPLERAQWGVAVHQSEDEVFASIRQLQSRIFGLMFMMLAGALVLVYLTTRSVITPVQALTAATQRIAAGDLGTPLGIHGKDEIGTLAQSFDAMRERLQESISEIHGWNRELDARVSDRTSAVEKAKTEITQLYEELQRKEQIRRELLSRVYAAHEEERKRIARELHDETAQVLTGLSYGLDDALEAPPSTNLRPQLERMHELTTTALKEIRRIILDLRPTMLDHLGLIPAIRWYAETRLNGSGIRFSIREEGVARRLAPAIETALFRVAQEAINNIAQHSRATHAELIFKFEPTEVQVWIADNGKGFDPASVFVASDPQHGVGLIGMEERMSAVGGTLKVQSIAREGTAIQLTVAIKE